MQKGNSFVVAVISALWFVSFSVGGSLMAQQPPGDDQPPPPVERRFDVPPGGVFSIQPPPPQGGEARNYNNVAWSQDGQRFAIDALVGDDKYLVVRDAADATGDDLDVALPEDALFPDITAWSCDDEKVIFPVEVAAGNQICDMPPAPGGSPCHLSFAMADGSNAGETEAFLLDTNHHTTSPSIICDFVNDLEYLLWVEKDLDGDNSRICTETYAIGETPDYAEKLCITTEDPATCTPNTARWSPEGRPSPEADRVAVKCNPPGLGGPPALKGQQLPPGDQQGTFIAVIGGVQAILSGDESPIEDFDPDAESRVVVVAEGVSGGSQPTWSLDGEYLFYVVENGADELDVRGQPLPMGVQSIRIKKSDGTGEAQAFNASDNSQNWLSFSPNGVWLAYTEDTDGDNAKEPFILPVLSENVITTDGGEAADLGYASIEVPEGIVEEDTTFSLVAPSPGADPGTLPEDTTGFGVIRELTAENESEGEVSQFPGELQITLPYSERELDEAGVTAGELTIYVLNETTDEWEPVTDDSGNPVEPVIDEDSGTVTIPTTHFSTYQIVTTAALEAGDDDSDETDDDTGGSTEDDDTGAEDDGGGGGGCSLVP